MCSVSMVADDWQKRVLPNILPQTWPRTGPTQEEFNRLKKEVEKLREELKKAQQQDIENGEPDCDNAEKTEILEEVAKLVGISLKEFLRGSQNSRRK